MWALVLLSCWVWVCEGMVARSSDPAVISQLDPVFDGPFDMPAFDPVALPNVTLGNPPGILTDSVGEPLTPQDFIKSEEMVHDPVDTAAMGDPTIGQGLFQGDIIVMSPEQLAMLTMGDGAPKARSAVMSVTEKWPNGVIPYVISASYSECLRRRGSTIARAIRILQDSTCIRIVPRQHERDYVHILKSSGCSSSVGRQGGAQALTLGDGCLHVGVVMHEFTHAIGFWHEHSRADRDGYIMINRANIQAGMEYNFKKYSWQEAKYLGVPYDLGSIMHYGRNAFAKDRNKDTIIPLQNVQIGQRVALSKLDIQKINILYCDGAQTGSKPKPTGGSSCSDSSVNCKAWASKGECSKNPVYMHTSCCVSCRDSIKVTPTDTKDCKDSHKDCAAWSQSGECTKNPAYMKIKCKKSCDTCPKKVGSGCVDSNKHCSSWARDGECLANPDYMKKYCAKSCGTCR